MKKAHWLYSLLLLLLLLLALGAGRGQAAPLQQSGNLLQNPGMEPPYNNGVADKWQFWFRDTPKSTEDCTVAYHYQPRRYGESNDRTYIREGSGAQTVANNWDTWAGGVYQTVPATPGTTYRFTFYAKGRAANEGSVPSETGLNMNLRAGIDPNGSGNWADGDVVWGGAGSAHDQWAPFTVETTATGNQITVFTAADWGVTGVNQCRKFLDIWFDSAELVAQTPPTATPAPLPTAAPATAAPPTATAAPAIPTEAAAATLQATLAATAAPAATATSAGSGAICANAFLDQNGNGLHDSNEGFVTDVTLTIAQGSAIIGQAVSTGTDKPVCISNLIAGTYQVAQSVPAALESTTQSNATVQVTDGQTVGLEFGSRLRGVSPTTTAPVDAAGQPTPTLAAGSTTDNGSSGGQPTWLVAIGLASVVVGIGLLCGLLYVLLRRQA